MVASERRIVHDTRLMPKHRLVSPKGWQKVDQSNGHRWMSARPGQAMPSSAEARRPNFAESSTLVSSLSPTSDLALRKQGGIQKDHAPLFSGEEGTDI